MMNVIQIQDALKGMPMEQLIREMQMPSGQAPQFLVLGEITRRRQMEKEFAQRQGQPQTTVAQDAIAGGGLPQGGIADMARAMAPQTDMAMNAAAMPQQMPQQMPQELPTEQPVQGMADGGYVQKMQAGGIADRERAARRLERQITPRVGTLTTDPRILRLANAFGVTVAEAIRMVENNPELLAATETPSAMVTSPGISRVEGGAEAGYDPASMTARDILAASAGEYDPTLRRVSSDTSMFLPAAPPRPVGGSLVTPPPFPPPDRFDPTAMPDEMERDMARAAAGEEALRSRVGMSTADAAQDAAERERLMARAGLLPLLGMQSQAARAAAGEAALESRGGTNTADASREANEAKRIREEMDRFLAERLFQKTDNQPGEATRLTGRNVVSVMPGAGAAPTMPGAPDQPGLPALLAAIGGGAPQEAPRRPVGAQNLPLTAGLGDTMRGQEGAAAAYDSARSAGSARMAGFEPLGGGVDIEAILAMRDAQRRAARQAPTGPARAAQFEPTEFDAAADFAARRAAENVERARDDTQTTPPRGLAGLTVPPYALRGEPEPVPVRGPAFGGGGVDFMGPIGLDDKRIFPQQDFDPASVTAYNAAIKAKREAEAAALEADRLATDARMAAAAGMPTEDLARRAEDARAEADRLAATAQAAESSAESLVAEEAAAAAPEVETLEGGTTPADAKPLIPPLPPGRVAPTVRAPAPAPTGGIAAAMSPFETEITKLLQQREKRAEQDKWLALAQVGLGLMGSRQPTFGAALGEAGAAGLQQFQQGRAQYDKDRLELMALLENTRLARAKLAAASAPKARLLPDEVLTAFDDEIEATRAALSDPLNPPTPAEKMRLTAQLNNLLTEKANARGAFFAQYGYAMPPAAPAASGVYSTDDVRS